MNTTRTTDDESLSEAIQNRYVANPVGPTHKGPNMRNRCDLEFCNECGHSGDPADMGVYVDTMDVKDDQNGGVDEIAELEAERLSLGEFQGFEEDDIGFWCDNCWSVLLNKRTE